MENSRRQLQSCDPPAYSGKPHIKLQSPNIQGRMREEGCLTLLSRLIGFQIPVISLASFGF